VKRALTAVATCVLLGAACGSGSPSTTAGDIGAGLSGPSGLAAAVYASGVANAAALAFDGDGRLWVATADYSDSGRDGVYLVASPGASPVAVVSGLHTALGLLWYQQMLYVASKVGVEAYGGFDGTAFAFTRTVVALPADGGEVNGLVLAPDGRMQLGISAPCDHCTPTNEYSGTIVSFLPDGTDLRVDANGIRAPIGLTYFPGTSDLFVTMNHRDDLGGATPGDWLAVVRPGQSWGFPDCYGQGGTVCSGVPAPVAELDKHAAVSGVAIWNGNAVVAEWTTGKVQLVALTKSDATYTGTVTTLLTGLTNPVPVIVGPDNALYVGDWTTGTVVRVTS
jgi:glucose/arabinose dehydrogenase